MPVADAADDAPLGADFPDADAAGEPAVPEDPDAAGDVPAVPEDPDAPDRPDEELAAAPGAAAAGSVQSAWRYRWATRCPPSCRPLRRFATLRSPTPSPHARWPTTTPRGRRRPSSSTRRWLRGPARPVRRPVQKPRRPQPRRWTQRSPLRRRQPPRRSVRPSGGPVRSGRSACRATGTSVAPACVGRRWPAAGARERAAAGRSTTRRAARRTATWSAAAPAETSVGCAAASRSGGAPPSDGPPRVRRTSAVVLGALPALELPVHPPSSALRAELGGCSCRVRRKVPSSASVAASRAPGAPAEGDGPVVDGPGRVTAGGARRTDRGRRTDLSWTVRRRGTDEWHWTCPLVRLRSVRALPRPGMSAARPWWSSRVPTSGPSERRSRSSARADWRIPGLASVGSPK